VSTDPHTNLTRLGQALAPFSDADLVIVFGDERASNQIKAALEDIAAPDLTTLMVGADHGLTGTFHGAEGFIEAWRDYVETFQRLDNQILEMHEVNPDLIYTETRQTGTTATAGVEIDYAGAAIFRFADGLLQQAEFHLDRDAARRAAGIEPDHPRGD
jgi:ketosteroid isomerase-like protein